MTIRTAGTTDIGGRAHNDDTMSIRQDKDRAWVFVGDGLGGYAGGEQASQAAARALMERSHLPGLLTEEGMQEAAELANRAVVQTQRQSGGSMKTTLVFLALEEGFARWMHVGDSRLYHFRNGLLEQQTVDHSVSQMAVLMGQITPRQIRFHEDRNRILRALGGDNSRAEISARIPVCAGEDAFLLCTDGFWEYVYEEEMEQLLSACTDPRHWLERMLELVHSRAPENADNCTAVAVFC